MPTPPATAILAAFACALAGCSSSGPPDPIFANTPTGPDTKQLVKQLPEGLPGDRENARYLSQPLVAPQIVAPDRGS